MSIKYYLKGIWIIILWIRADSLILRMDLCDKQLEKNLLKSSEKYYLNEIKKLKNSEGENE